MIDGSKVMFMMRFNQGTHDQDEVKEISGIPAFFHQQLLHAEIEYHSGNHSQSLKYLSELIPMLDKVGHQRELLKTIIDHNVGVVLAQRQPHASQLIFSRCL